MTILIIGGSDHVKECQEKFGIEHQYVHQSTHVNIQKVWGTANVIFDFLIASNKDRIEEYQSWYQGGVFFNTTFVSLAELCKNISPQNKTAFFGFCGLPSFVKRPMLETTVISSEQEELLKDTCQKLSTEYVLVDDRVGLVTPRIIGMIINEAYYTVQEGTATIEDVDLAMKLGTNYPYGPFEWCQKIGRKNVYDLLSALYEDTKDERYKICALLKKEVLRSRSISTQ